MVRVDSADPTPPYEQIRRQLADEIGSGNLVAGDRLPSVRQLAGDLSLAPGTVARAYAELESAGLVESNRTGTRVKRTAQLPDGLRAAAKDYVRAARNMTLEDAVRAVRAEWEGRGTVRGD
ncbi:MAG: GntR family transcriptional regulator [Glaciihabitans sp.]|nr:GntR family transcriptional regulator [Glaciihabitans sp.]MCU1533907.1 GntR family transcriptional regulator [Glaciihabitans sp.]